MYTVVMLLVYLRGYFQLESTLSVYTKCRLGDLFMSIKLRTHMKPLGVYYYYTHQVFNMLTYHTIINY